MPDMMSFLPRKVALWFSRLADAAFAHPARALAVVWFLLCAPWLLGRRALRYDAAQEFYPSVAFTVQQLRDLQGPWWNPYLFGGFPHFADPQGMTFQPTVILPMLFSSLPSLGWFTAVVVLHVLLGGLGALQLAKRYRLQPPAQLLFALTMMFGGVAASRMQHVPMIVSYAFLPWLLWALHRLAERPGVARAALAGLLGGLCALQLTQVTYLIAIASAVYALTLIPSAAQRGRYVAMLALAGVIALLVSLPQWLSTLSLLPHTNRMQLGLDATLSGRLSPSGLATLVGLDFFRDGAYLGPGDLTQDYLYLGAVPLALWAMWGASVLPEHRRLARGLLAVIVVALVYSLGTHTPVYAGLHRVLPGVDLFRRPADGLFLIVPAAAMLAALALDARMRGATRQRHPLAWCLLVALVAYAIWVATGELHWSGALAGVAWVLVAGAAVVWMTRGTRPLSHTVLMAVLALAVFDLSMHNVRTEYYGGRDDARKLYRDADWPDASASTLVPALTRLRDELRRGPVPERAEVLGIDDFINGASVRGVAMTSGYNPMLLASYAHVAGAQSGVVRRAAERPFTEWAPDYQAPLFDLLGLRAIVSREPLDGAEQVGAVYWKSRDSVLPRVLTPTRVRAHAAAWPPSDEFARTDFHTDVWILDRNAKASACARSSDRAATVGEVDYRANRVQIDYRATQASWLVLNEIDAPGWMALVDGREVPLVRANGLFRAACVPAGAHRLTFAFSPLRMIASRGSIGRE